MPKRKWAEAEKHFKEAIDIYPAYALAWSELGTALEQQDRLTEASGALAKASAADPKYIKPIVQLAKIAGKQSQWEDELHAANRALALHPVDFPGAYFYHAEASYHLDRWKERSAAAARQSSPTPVQKSRKRVSAWHNPRRRDDARAALEQLHAYLKIDPKGDNAGEAKAQIAKLEQLSKNKN